jgi:hypothetical protein
MNILEWSKSEVDYGRKLVDSAVAGARRGENEFLRDQSLGLYVERSALHAMGPTVVGACLGWFGGQWKSRGSKKLALTCACLGGAIGFGAGVLWENRRLTARIASGAWTSIRKTRDAHWFEKNPIDYA